MELHRTTISFFSLEELLFTTQSSLAWPFARVMIEALLLREDSWRRHMSAFPPLRSISLHCELTEAFCLSQGTVWAKQRPGNVCTTMITGARRGPTRAALSAARVKRTSGCIATPLGSTPQGPSSWWRKAAGWMTSTAMTGGVLLWGSALLSLYTDSSFWPTVDRQKPHHMYLSRDLLIYYSAEGLNPGLGYS